MFVVILSDAFFDISKINELTRSDGLVIVLFFSIFIYYLISMMRNKVKNDAKGYDKPKYAMGRAVIYTLMGLAGIVFGSDLVVDSAVNISNFLGISERVISITVIAVGTSLPELATSITAVLKGEDDLLVGNIIGSNIFNICVVLGLPVLLIGGIIPKSFTSVDLMVLALSSILLYVFSRTGNKIKRIEGVFMLSCYVLYYVYLFMT